MARLADLLLQSDPWSHLIMGNHAVARAMLEAGVMVATTYPGSPTPEIAAALGAIPADQRPYHLEIATNEKVALEVAAGASLNGHLATVFFKSVGLNVASDSLIQLSLMELIGGMVVILGDDPGANSSQNEQDNRHFARMAYIPMLEPATPREAYEMFLEAARLSVQQKHPIFLRMTTHVCHAKEVVEFGARPRGAADWTPAFAAENGPYIPLAASVFPLKRRALRKLAAFGEAAEKSRFNSVQAPHGCEAVAGKRYGVIASGLPGLALLENLETVGKPIDLLRLGFSFPLPRRTIRDFLARHDEVVIVEELDRVMETEIKALAWDAAIECRLLTRTEDEALMGELTPDRTAELLASHWPHLFPASPPVPGLTDGGDILPRLPQLCPGCGHRSAFHAIKRALPPDTITVADIGCHTMGSMPPYEMGQVLLSMGHAVATGSGLALGNRQRKVVAFIGDSTLFHAGLPGIVNAAMRDHDLTLIVMENGTTAMTGHQPRAGSGEIGEKIPLPEMFAALGVRFVRDVDAYSQAQLAMHVKEALDHSGFSVVIARHPCMLKFMRDLRRHRPETAIRPVAVNQQACNQSYVCVQDFACPSFVRHEDGTVTVHEDLCIGDGSCLQTCPVEALGRAKRSGGEG